MLYHKYSQSKIRKVKDHKSVIKYSRKRKSKYIIVKMMENGNNIYNMHLITTVNQPMHRESIQHLTEFKMLLNV